MDNRKDLLKKSRTHHGGDIYSKGHEDLIDLSSNINPMKIPGKVYEKLPEILEKAGRYPDIEYSELKENISDYLNYLTGTQKFVKEYITVGCGAVDLIDKTISLFDHIVILRPSFSEYTASAVRYNKEIIFADRDMESERGVLKDSAAKEILNASGQRENTLVCLCSPNNPDGAVWDINALQNLLFELKKKNSSVMMDETFGEYMGDMNASSLHLTGKFSNLIVIKALTKFFGLPGVRLGYGITSDEKLSEKIAERQTTWNVGTFASEIAGIMMSDREYIGKSIEINRERRSFLEEILERSELFEEIFPSHSDFISAELKSTYNPKSFSEFLLHKGILVRNLSDMFPLGDSHFRFAVKDKGISLKLSEAMDAFKDTF